MGQSESLPETGGASGRRGQFPASLKERTPIPNIENDSQL